MDSIVKGRELWLSVRIRFSKSWVKVEFYCHKKRKRRKRRVEGIRVSGWLKLFVYFREKRGIKGTTHGDKCRELYRLRPLRKGKLNRSSNNKWRGRQNPRFYNHQMVLLKGFYCSAQKCCQSYTSRDSTTKESKWVSYCCDLKIPKNLIWWNYTDHSNRKQKNFYNIGPSWKSWFLVGQKVPLYLRCNRLKRGRLLSWLNKTDLIPS